MIDCGLGEGVGVGGREITSRAGQPTVPREVRGGRMLGEAREKQRAGEQYA